MSDIKEGNGQLSLSSSLPRVTYSCGSCGYQLNLNSDNRNTSSVICAKYSKLIKRGIITFFCIDETRFDLIENPRRLPFFSSKNFRRRRTKLLCRKCGNHIGNAYPHEKSRARTVEKSCPDAWDGMSGSRVYDVKIRALQPSYADDE